MQILHVIDSAGIYGAEVMLLNLMEAQQSLGLQPILASIGDLNVNENPLETEALHGGLEVIKIRMRRGYTFTGALKLVKIARDQSTDLFHIHGYKGEILLGSVPRWLRKIPAVRTLHGWTSTKKISKICWYECLDRYFMRKMDAIVWVNSNSSVTRRPRFLKNTESFVVENGIPELSFSPDSVMQSDVETFDFCKNAFVIGTIGRLSAEKGFKYLVEAMSSLLINEVDYKLVIIGEGDQRRFLEKMIRDTGLSHKILLAGYRRNATDYLPLFDIFILPSLSEGLPITLLEAMQAERPIIATHVGGVPEALGTGRYGMLVEPKDTKALADAVSYLRKNPVIAYEMAKEAREVALTRYSSRRMAEEYSKIYETVLGN